MSLIAAIKSVLDALKEQQNQKIIARSWRKTDAQLRAGSTTVQAIRRKYKASPADPVATGALCAASRYEHVLDINCWVDQ